MNKWLILKERIGSELNNLKIILEENKIHDETFNNINHFLESYRNGNPNFDILYMIPDDIIDKNQKQEFIQNFQLKRQIESSSFFNRQLNQCNVIINKFINGLYLKSHKLMTESIKRKNYNNILEETINLYEQAYSIITDKGINQICNQNLLNVIIDVITELDIDDYSMIEMIQELKQINEKLINNDKNKVNSSNENNNENEAEKSKDDIIVKGIKIINEINEIIEYFETIFEQYYNTNIDSEKYANIYARIEYLKEIINDYNESLKIYVDSNKTDDEAIKYFYNELSEGHAKLSKEKGIIEMKKQSLETFDDFYVPANQIKNLIVFIPVDDLDVSNMECSLNNDEKIQNSDYNSIKLTLKRLILGEEDILTTHIAKSQNYSEEFLKKYHVKGIKSSKCRIMYSRYSTTLKQKYPQFSTNPNVVFIFNAGYGYLDGNQKHDLYEKGLSECFKYKDQIETIKNLLNIDWSNISPDEQEKKDKEIKTLFDLQKKKMDHFLNTCIKIPNLDGKTL